ncbi:acyltransferase family protein [Serratia odorifera]|nr:acyltransferase [Serratia odorifera]PNK88389.1 acyltransferase [Serratia odorifera]RII69368.1 acyltransferase [Serratia odorifera]
MRNGKINSIQILRGVACLLVMLSHYQVIVLLTPGDYSTRIHWFDWGASGVDLFFVISGFIMVHTARNKKPSITTSFEFIKNRAVRILPAYYFWLIVSFAIGGAMSIFHYESKTESLVSALTFIPNIKETAPNYIADDGFYIVRWTLNYEIYFYLAFSLCLLCANRLRAVLVWAIFSSIIMPLATTGALTLSTMGYKFDSVINMLLTNPIVLEFAMGAVVGTFHDKVNIVSKKAATYALIILTTLLTYALLSKWLLPFHLLTGLAFSILLALVVRLNEYVCGFFHKAFITIGNMSFSLYLAHLPVAYFYRKEFSSLVGGHLSQTLFLVILIATSLLLGFLSHKYIEIKVGDRLKQRYAV